MGDIILTDGAIVIPKSIRRDILIKAHSTHQGIVRTKQYLRNVVFRSGLSSEIDQMRKDCRICQQILPQDELPLSPVTRPEGPWLQIDIDLYSSEFDHYLTIQDYYSEWPEVYKLTETTTRAVIASLKDCFSRFGKPQKTHFQQRSTIF